MSAGLFWLIAYQFMLPFTSVCPHDPKCDWGLHSRLATQLLCLPSPSRSDKASRFPVLTLAAVCFRSFRYRSKKLCREMAPFKGRSTTTIAMQRATSSSSSVTSNDDSDESSYLDSLEEARISLFDKSYVANAVQDYSNNLNGNDKLKMGYNRRPNFSNSAHRLPVERHKAILALVLLITAGFCNDLVLSFIHDKVPEQPPLPDLVFSVTPYIPQALTISEYLMLSLFGMLLILTFLHRHRWIVLRRIATIGSLLYFGRCFTMCVTQVPVADPNYYCAPKFNETQRNFVTIAVRALKIATGAGLKINGKHTLCGDYIYSGHTIVLVTSYLFIREYSPRNWKTFHFASAVFSFIGVVLLLISRGHYTVDVLISYWICTRVFWQYHTMAGTAVLRKNRSQHNHLTKVFWFPLFNFMEYNVLRPVPPRYGLPFSYLDCKKWFKSRASKFNNN